MLLSATILVILCTLMAGCASTETSEANNAQPTQEELLNRAIDEKISSMSLHDKVSQMVIVRPEQLSEGNTSSFTEESAENLQEYPFGGVCYFSENLSDAEVLKSFIEALQAAANDSANGIGMFTCVDEEGGGLAYPNAEVGVVGKSGIARLAEAGFPGCEKMYPMYFYKDDGEEVAYNNAATIADYLEIYGFNWDFAPVADVNSNPSNPIIGYRAYGDDWNETAQLVAAAVRGYEDRDMATSLKHFPGHGDTDTDSHKTDAIIDDKDYNTLLSQELVPFKAGIEAGADSVMMGHIIVKSVDDMPSSLSSFWYDMLRDELGFDGIAITDSLEMDALTNRWSNDEIAVMATQAGCDILLLPQDPYAAVDTVVEAVEAGDIDEARIDESIKRILAMKANHDIWIWQSE